MPISVNRQLLAISAVLFSGIALACGGGSPTAPGVTDFQGVWEGQWQLTSCTESGGATGTCSQTPGSGGLRLTLTQTGTTVQGNVELVSSVIPSSGSVNAGGALTLAGSARIVLTVEGVQQGHTETLSNWSTTRSGNAMNGSFTLTTLPDTAAFGSQTLQLALQNVTKTS